MTGPKKWRWGRHLQAFERRQHRDRRRDGAVAIDQRRAEQTDGNDGGSLPLLHPQQRHQSQNAAFAVIVDAHGERDIFHAGDDEQRPQHQRQRAQDHGGIGRASGSTEDGLEGVERAGADIAKHDPERRQAEDGQFAAGELRRGFIGILRCQFRHFSIQPEYRALDRGAGALPWPLVSENTGTVNSCDRRGAGVIGAMLLIWA
jgi:hypothetical protein